MRSRGLGDTIAKATKAVGIKPCGGCKRRQRRLNKWFPYKQNPMDIVIPLASGSHGRKRLGSKWDNNELRYALRSMEKYFINLGRVFIVTEILPPWLQNVVHLYAKDHHRRNKDANLIDKVLLACWSGVSDTFIRMSDDQCLLQEWDGEGLWHMGDKAGDSDDKWWKRFRHTCDYLESKGRPTLFYDSHCPIPVDRKEFIRIAEEADYVSPPGMCINTLYANSVDIERVHMNGQKVAVHKAMGPNRLAREVEGKLFLGYSQVGTNESMKRFLQERFPMPSKYENDIDRGKAQFEHRRTRAMKRMRELQHL